MVSFRNSLLKTSWSILKPIYNMHIPPGLTLLNRLRVGLSHLNQHKFNHNFREWVNPLCPCSLEIESPLDFFLHCHYFTDIWKTFFNGKLSVDGNTLNQSDNEIWNCKTTFLMVIKNLNSNRTAVYQNLLLGSL